MKYYICAVKDFSFMLVIKWRYGICFKLDFLELVNVSNNMVCGLEVGKIRGRLVRKEFVRVMLVSDDEYVN